MKGQKAALIFQFTVYKDDYLIWGRCEWKAHDVTLSQRNMTTATEFQENLPIRFLIFFTVRTIYNHIALKTKSNNCFSRCIIYFTKALVWGSLTPNILSSGNNEYPCHISWHQLLVAPDQIVRKTWIMRSSCLQTYKCTVAIKTVVNGTVNSRSITSICPISSSNISICTSVVTHPGNCHHSFPAPVVSESARRLTAESTRGSRP